jgi:hypothetical protein
LTAALPIANGLRARPEPTALANEQTARTTAETQLNEIKGKLTTAETALANERTAHAATVKARNEALVAGAIREGRIVEASKDTWMKRLDRDFAVESVALANEQSGPKTQARTDNLGARKESLEAGSQFTALVNERMAKTGEAWPVAWKAVKQTKEGQALHQKMETAKS